MFQFCLEMDRISAFALYSIRTNRISFQPDISPSARYLRQDIRPDIRLGIRFITICILKSLGFPSEGFRRERQKRNQDQASHQSLVSEPTQPSKK